MSNNKKNIQESLRQQLKNLAREKKRPFDEILRYYAIERFLYRLSISPYKNLFFLKGGLLFRIWDEKSHRATRDIDLLGLDPFNSKQIETFVKDVCSIPGKDDGISFDTAEILIQEIHIGVRGA